VYRTLGKRLLDLLVVIPVAIAVFPLLLIVSFLIKVKLGHPIIFRQPRAGFQGNVFTVYKFRTMTDSRDIYGDLLPDDERLPPFGRLLRRLSLDELPQIWNVLRGEMGLVGPRPLLTAYLDHYSPEQTRRHDVTPGVTGWAQVNGRNALSWEEKFELDVWYVDNLSLWLDLKILCRTVARVVRRDDVSADGCATMTEFRGPITRQ
jgi:sugar transferase EpsL